MYSPTVTRSGGSPGLRSGFGFAGLAASFSSLSSSSAGFAAGFGATGAGATARRALFGGAGTTFGAPPSAAEATVRVPKTNERRPTAKNTGRNRRCHGRLETPLPMSLVVSEESVLLNSDGRGCTVTERQALCAL